MSTTERTERTESEYLTLNNHLAISQVSLASVKYCYSYLFMVDENFKDNEREELHKLYVRLYKETPYFDLFMTYTNTELQLLKKCLLLYENSSAIMTINQLDQLDKIDPIVGKFVSRMAAINASILRNAIEEFLTVFLAVDRSKIDHRVIF
jgi:hypothetical protein